MLFSPFYLFTKTKGKFATSLTKRLKFNSLIHVSDFEALANTTQSPKLQAFVISFILNRKKKEEEEAASKIYQVLKYSLLFS